LFDFRPRDTGILLASRDSNIKNVWVHSMIIPELKLRDVERQIFAAYLVIAAHDAAFENRPETLNRVGVNGTDNVPTTPRLKIDQKPSIVFV
jgi:hypothetical protein